MTVPRVPDTLFVAAILLILASVPAPAAIKTQWIDYKQGDQALQGYLAYDDARRGKRPGVLLVHRRDGMSAMTQNDVERIARLGYVVFAPDIYGKEFRPTEVKEMIALSRKFQDDRVLMRARIAAGFDILRNNPRVDAAKIALLGYCFGGNVAVEFAEQGPSIVGSVIIHGSFRNFVPGAAKNIHGSMLILHGADDTEAPLSDVFRLTSEMTANKIGWELRLYSGTTHNFTAEPQNDEERHANTESQAATASYLKEVFAR
ncbi:MAG TPA: dienelactone hydrolase family protein [Stellaceae bacterium]|jgi:dienelactone hydrolase